MARLVVIGDGIAARMALFRLFQGIAEGHSPKIPLTEVVQIADSPLSPAASRRSTAHVGTHGMQKGVSPLGDLLVSACHETFAFFSNMTESECLDWGVHRGEHLALATHSNEKEVAAFFRRYETERKKSSRLGLKNGESLNLSDEVYSYSMPHLLFRPDRFLQKLEDEILQYQRQTPLAFSRLRGHVESVDNSRVRYLSYESGRVEDISIGASFVCSGAFQALRGKTLTSTSSGKKKKLGQVRPGSFWRMSEKLPSPFDKLETPVVLSLGGSVLTYRPQDFRRELPAELLIGGTSFHDGQFVGVLWSELAQMWESWKYLLGGKETWPAFSAGEVITGLRHHLPKRHPYCGPWTETAEAQNVFFAEKVSPERIFHWETSGLYKNGYSLSFLAAKHICHHILGT